MKGERVMKLENLEAKLNRIVKEYGYESIPLIETFLNQHLIKHNIIYGGKIGKENTIELIKGKWIYMFMCKGDKIIIELFF